MMEQSRVLLAVVLSLGVMFVYYTFFDPYTKSQTAAPAATTSAPVPAPATSPVPVAPLAIPSQTTRPSALPSAPETTDQVIYLNNDSISIGISVPTGTVVSAELKKYHAETSKDSPLIQLVDKESQALVYTDGQAASIFSVKESTPGKIILSSAAGQTRTEKIFELSAQNPYLVNFSVQQSNETDKELVVNPTLWILKKQKPTKTGSGIFSYIHEPEDFILPMSYVEDAEKMKGTSSSTERNKLLSETDWKGLPEEILTRGRVVWTAIGDRYFLTSILARTLSSQEEVKYGKKDQSVYTSLSYGSLSIKPASTASFQYSAYFGPKDLENLKSVGANLEKSVDYGWFGSVAILLLALLQFFYRLIGNWGLAIILLTFVVKLILHPVNKKSMESMRAMQKLQPKLAEIKQKFGTNKEKLNAEMMMLFKTHKVNPMSGCLPMILQMPIYIALYKVLWNAIELYHAPFFWFYRDLSKPDPYFITPILLGVVMALQQKFTPSTAQIDPAQQKVMMLMPIVFSAFMLFFPSGLVIYILVNTLVSVVQQYFIHREIDVWQVIKRKFAS